MRLPPLLAYLLRPLIQRSNRDSNPIITHGGLELTDAEMRKLGTPSENKAYPAWVSYPARVFGLVLFAGWSVGVLTIWSNFVAPFVGAQPTLDLGGAIVLLVASGLLGKPVGLIFLVVSVIAILIGNANYEVDLLNIHMTMAQFSVFAMFLVAMGSLFDGMTTKEEPDTAP